MAYAEVRVFIPRQRLVWQSRVHAAGGAQPTPIGGVPGEHVRPAGRRLGPARPAAAAGHCGSSAGKALPADWDLLTQRWTCQLAPATQPALATILQSVPTLPAFGGQTLRRRTWATWAPTTSDTLMRINRTSCKLSDSRSLLSLRDEGLGLRRDSAERQHRIGQDTPPRPFHAGNGAGAADVAVHHGADGQLRHGGVLEGPRAERGAERGLGKPLAAERRRQSAARLLAGRRHLAADRSGQLPDQVDDPRVDQPVARGPVIMNALVNTDLLDPTRGLCEGSADAQRGIGPCWARWPPYQLHGQDVPAGRPVAVQHGRDGDGQQPAAADPDHLHAAPGPGQPLQRLHPGDPGDHQCPVSSSNSTLLNGFYPQLAQFCSQDRADAQQPVQNLIDHIQGNDKPHVAGVAETMARAYHRHVSERTRASQRPATLANANRHASDLDLRAGTIHAIAAKRVMTV